MTTVIDCPRYPGEDYLGNRIVRTDEMVDDLGVRWFEGRAIAFARENAPMTPFYHLKVTREPGIWPRYRVRAFQNRAEPRDP